MILFIPILIEPWNGIKNNSVIGLVLIYIGGLEIAIIPSTTGISPSKVKISGIHGPGGFPRRSSDMHLNCSTIVFDRA